MYRITLPLRLPLVVVSSLVLAAGCAADYSPHADLASVHTIGVVILPDRTVPGSDNTRQSDPVAPGEDRPHSSAVVTGSGAAAGTATGVGVAALVGCTATLPAAPWCWALVLAGGVAGGSAGKAISKGHAESVAAVPAEHYEVGSVLPALMQEQLSRPALRARALQVARAQDTGIHFVPAEWDGKRYVPPAAGPTDVNLVLSSLSVSLQGKDEDDANVGLDVDMHWLLTRYSPKTRTDEVWDALPARYESAQHPLSEWLADDGVLLKTAVDAGIEKTLTDAFAVLPDMVR